MEPWKRHAPWSAKKKKKKQNRKTKTKNKQAGATNGAQETAGPSILSTEDFPEPTQKRKWSTASLSPRERVGGKTLILGRGSLPS